MSMMDGLIADIDKNTEAFKASFMKLSEEELNWKPAPERWSIAQNIDHLIRINESYFPVIRQVRKGSYQLPWIARFGFVTRFFGNMLLRAVDPGYSRKSKTFNIWEPAINHIPADILDLFGKHQAALKQLIIESSDLVEQRTIISSPANRFVIYSLYTAFEVMILHEKRHLMQAKEVLVLLEKASIKAKN